VAIFVCLHGDKLRWHLSQKLALMSVSKVYHQKRNDKGDHLTGKVGSLVASRVVDGDAGQRFDLLGSGSALGAPLEGGVAVLVIQVDAEVCGLGALHLNSPSKLVLRPVFGPGNLDKSSISLVCVVEGQIVNSFAVASQAELGDEGSVGQDLGVRGNVAHHRSLGALTR